MCLLAEREAMLQCQCAAHGADFTPPLIFFGVTGWSKPASDRVFDVYPWLSFPQGSVSKGNRRLDDFVLPPSFLLDHSETPVRVESLSGVLLFLQDVGQR